MFFFFCVKIKSLRETIFGLFFIFFTGKKVFHAHVFKYFHGHFGIFTGTFEKNSRIDFNFSRVDTQQFSRKGSTFYAYSFRYLDAQIAQNLNCIIDRAIFWEMRKIIKHFFLLSGKFPSKAVLPGRPIKLLSTSRKNPNIRINPDRDLIGNPIVTSVKNV